MENSNFELLPKETKDIVAKFLDARSRRMMRATSTQWFHIINYDEFTIYFARPSTLPDLVKTFSRYSKPIGLRFEKTISIDGSYTMLAALTNLTKLEADPSKDYTPNELALDLRHFTVLTALNKLSFANQNFTPFIIACFPNMTHITIKGIYEWIMSPAGSQNINVISKLGNVTRLRSLEIEDYRGVLGFDSESVEKMSNVSKVSLQCRGVRFPFSKLPNLESLEVSDNQFDDFSMTTKLTWLSITCKSKPKWEEQPIPSHDFQQLAALENLRYLDLDIPIEDLNHYSFLLRLTNLESLTISSMMGVPPFLQFVNSSKLTYIASSSQFDLAHLSRLTSLQRLFTHGVVADADGEKEEPLKFTNLTELITHQISTAKYCPNIKRLTLFNAAKMTQDGVFSSLASLEALYTRQIDNSVLRTIGGLTNLTQLVVQFDGTTNYEYDALKNLTGLKVLQFSMHMCRYDVNCSGLLPLLRILTNLEELDLFQIDDETVKLLEGLPNLKRLKYKATLQGFDEAKLSNLTNLQTLKRMTFPFGHTQQHDCKLKNLPYLYNCASN